MQKYYIRDFLTKELEKNDGKLTQYYVENDHEAIIEREIWDAAQLEINRIKEFKRNHQIRELGSCSLEPFYGKIFLWVLWWKDGEEEQKKCVAVHKFRQRKGWIL